MILPKDFLDKIHYYHLDSSNSAPFVDVITLYFKSWWLPKQSFVFHKYMDGVDEQGFVIYLPSHELVELIIQLRQYIFNDVIDLQEDNDINLSKVGNVIYLNRRTEKSSTDSDFTEPE